jgi:hypothetical protein
VSRRRTTPRKPRNPTAAQKARWRGISRIEQPSTRTFGWFVRIGFRTKRDGSYAPRHTKFFGDASHKGVHGSLRAARAWRDECLDADARQARAAKRARARRAA